MEKTNIRTLILEALMLIDVEGEYSHKVLDMALEKYGQRILFKGSSWSSGVQTAT